MPKAEVKIIEATKNKVILEGTLGKDERMSIPKAARGLISSTAKVRFTIETIEG